MHTLRQTDFRLNIFCSLIFFFAFVIISSNVTLLCFYEIKMENILLEGSADFIYLNLNIGVVKN
jgi:hypothetical protein